jgi:hypothetical protein
MRLLVPVLCIVLASDDSRWITGKALYISGGYG